VRPGEKKKGIVLTLSRGVSASGRVVDGQSKPIANAKVECATDLVNGGRRGFRRSRGGSSDEDSVLTNASGKFSFDHLNAGTYRFTASHSGHSEKSLSGVKVPGDGKPIPDIVLSPSAAIEGFVRDGAGQPVIAATVNGNLASINETTETGPDGAFRLATFPAGAKPRLAAFASGYSMSMRTVEAPVKDVVLTLTSDGVIRGRVEDASSMAAVTAFSIGVGSSRNRTGGCFHVCGLPLRIRTEPSAACAPGKWTLTATRRTMPGSIGDVEVAPGETKDGSSSG
jgi:hypothetical protein